MLAHEITEAIQSNNRSRIAEVYKQVFGTELNKTCGDCIRDAKIQLQIKCNEIERESSPIFVYVSVYHDRNPVRQAELDECLHQNRINPHIEKVVELTGNRPTYNDFFQLFRDDAVNIIINSDIFFTHSVQLAKRIKANQCFALCRWDWNGNGKAKFLNRYDSQDAWIFRGRLKRNINAGFCLGIPGCDNRIAYEIRKAGYQILNPSATIHALHYHASGVRSYTDKTEAVPQPYHFITPSSL